jgi:SagB-type dehydrogenase family enzyme
VIAVKVKPYDEVIREKRELLKSSEIANEEWESHQHKGIPAPPVEKPCPKGAHFLELVKPKVEDFENVTLTEAIKNRESRRKYTPDPLRLAELSFLLWATQGIKAVDKNGVRTKRTVPSAGARHPFETYLIINRVKGVKPGVYRYLPIEHRLLLVNGSRPVPARIAEACEGQGFVGESAVVFVWAAIPYRTEWRYSVIGYKAIAVEAGHICQNLYLACEAIGAGACAILAYEQRAIDSLIGVDGEDEFTIYLASVGKMARAQNKSKSFEEKDRLEKKM